MGTMINRRRVCGGKKLPYDYEVEYIKFDAAGSGNFSSLKFYNLPADGYMDIDVTITGYGNRNDYPMVFGFEVYDVNSNYQFNRTTFYTQVRVSSSQFENGYGYVIFNNKTIPLIANYSRLKYHVKPNVDGSLKFLNIGGGTPLIFRTMKLYDTNYNLVFDVIPVSVNGIGQLYDKVSGKLGKNTGNMNFIAGPRV